jgi:NifB/MoaA-like Fe-S oxidoreductase
VLGYIKKLSDAGIKLRGQIVLCKGVNDGAELDRSMNDLYQYYPQLDSVSIVPAGLTRFRDNLYPLEPFTAEESLKVIEQVKAFGDMCLVHCGERVFYCSDEFYLKAGVDIPDYEYWGEFAQIENGVGMIASFEHEFKMALQTLSEDEKEIKKSVSVATGQAAYGMMKRIADIMTRECPNVTVNVYEVKNEFFGGEVTVTGLLTGKDLLSQLKGRALGEELHLSCNVLRNEGDLFLCGMTPDELSQELGVHIVFDQNDGGEFLFSLLGIEI